VSNTATFDFPERGSYVFVDHAGQCHIRLDDRYPNNLADTAALAALREAGEGGVSLADSFEPNHDEWRAAWLELHPEDK
jgi:hypothetical protein